MSVQFLDSVWTTSGQCPDSVCTVPWQRLDSVGPDSVPTVSGLFLNRVWILSGQRLKDVYTFTSQCLDSVSLNTVRKPLNDDCRISGKCLYSIRTVSHQFLDYLRTVPWNCLDINWTIYGYWLDSVYTVFGQFLKNTWNRSGWCQKSVWTASGVRKVPGQRLFSIWSMSRQWRQTTVSPSNKLV